MYHTAPVIRGVEQEKQNTEVQYPFSHKIHFIRCFDYNTYFNMHIMIIFSA